MPGDKRVRYTRLFLRESLIELLKLKPIARITVKELCEKADINRATYYSHYSDPSDQLHKIEAEFMEGISSYLDSHSLSGSGNSYLSAVTKIMEYIEENRELCRVLLGGNGDADFQQEIMEFLRQRVFDAWSSAIPDREYAYTFVATGSIGVARKWLFKESERETPEEIASIIVRLVNEGIA